ncbi:PTS system IIA component (Glc family) [Hypnocyclicus thermotrophus]|uniref:PTS system IIA component (Glc family) n=1 Tax=Hypnocyclicus thermotrophus TaxID=1627895 RepID=A0AA46DZ25_9FUSO|nr:PTS glucose transporter subunit IIA [Hypnocyclicus thermotrophus]TDT70560.1 PTS system IIA component (Glc family) [Hypnocyclicus thermotrophus]
MFKKFFKKKENVVEVYSPLDGEVIQLEKVPDDAFSSKIIGDGIAIIPNGDTIYAPFDSEDISIFDTKHAVSFQKGDIELIVHFGIDTVKLNGEGFSKLVLKDEGSVKKGEKLIAYDLNFIKNKAKSIISPIVVSSMDEIDEIFDIKYGKVNALEPIFKIRLKK